jgi:hypothetical protein
MKTISFTFDVYKHEKKYTIEKETDEYYYFTDAFTGEEKRYHKLKQIIEWKGMDDMSLKDDIWYPYSDNQSIVQVDIGGVEYGV